MSNCLKAVLISFAAHALVALALAFWIGHAAAVEIPLLDLSAVEVSFSEVEREASPAVPAPPPEESDPAPPPPEPDPAPSPPPEPDPAPPPPPEPDPAPPPPPEPDPAPPPSSEPVPPPPDPDTKIINEQTTEQINEPTAPVSESEAPKQAKVDAPPRPFKTIRPDYPKGARQRGEEGNVDLELAISANGRVESVSVVRSSGYPELDAAAVRAAKNARFTPAKSGRVAVASTARLTITFKLTSR